MPYNNDPHGDVWEALTMLVALIMLALAPVMMAALIAMYILSGPAW